MAVGLLGIADDALGQLPSAVRDGRRSLSFGVLTDGNEAWSPTGGAALGFGLEWFASDAMSLRGEVTLDGTYTYRKGSYSSGGGEDVSHRIDVGLGQSALAFSIHF